ncbi:Uncharacterized protein QTN25_007255 [Entamoeba marina]
MNDPIHKIPDDNKINSLVDLARNRNYKQMLKDINTNLKRSPQNLFLKSMKTYALAYTHNENESHSLLEELLASDVQNGMTINWIYNSFRALRDLDGYCRAVKHFYDKDPEDDGRMKEMYYVAHMKHDLETQQSLVNKFIQKYPKDHKYKHWRMKLMSQNPKTQIMVTTMYSRSIKERCEFDLLIQLYKDQSKYQEIINLYEKPEAKSFRIIDYYNLNKNYQLLADNVLNYLNDFDDEDYAAYEHLLSALKNLPIDCHDKYITIVKQHLNLQKSKTMLRSPYLFLIEYSIQQDNLTEITNSIRLYLEQFHSLRLCISDVFPLIPKHYIQHIIQNTTDYKLFNSQLLLSLDQNVTYFDDSMESVFVKIGSFISSYQNTHDQSYLFDALILIDQKLSVDEDEHELRMLQLKCFNLLSMVKDSENTYHHPRMDIKDVLLESTGYLFYPIFADLGTTDKYQLLVTKLMNFHGDHDVSLKENVVRSLDTLNWQAYDELFSFEHHLHHSATKESIKIFESHQQLMYHLVHSFENNLPFPQSLNPFIDILIPSKENNFAFISYYTQLLYALKEPKKFININTKDCCITQKPINQLILQYHITLFTNPSKSSVLELIDYIKNNKESFAREDIVVLQRNIINNILSVALTHFLLINQTYHKEELEQLFEILTSFTPSPLQPKPEHQQYYNSYIESYEEQQKI